MNVQTSKATQNPKAQNLLAIAAAVLFTALGVAALDENVNVVPVSEINGTKVINLAPINVHPTAADLRAAALLTDATAVPVAMLHAGASLSPIAASALGPQMAMPYYSFGDNFGRISKE